MRESALSRESKYLYMMLYWWDLVDTMRKPLPLGRMSLKAAYFSALADITTCDELRHRYLNQCRLIRIAMNAAA